MSTAKEFITSACILSVICTLAYVIMPSGNIKKYFSLVCTLVLLSLVASNIMGLDFDMTFTLDKSEIDNMTANGQSISDIIVNKSKENIEQAISDSICEKYLVARDDIAVSVSIDASNIESIKISGVSIKIYGLSNMIKVTKIKEFAQSSYYCTCNVEFCEER